MDVTAKLGHQKLDILKIDAEGGEISLLPIFLSQDRIKICQISIEIHVDYERLLLVTGLLEKIAIAGFLLFSVESNTFCQG